MQQLKGMFSCCFLPKKNKSSIQNQASHNLERRVQDEQARKKSNLSSNWSKPFSRLNNEEMTNASNYIMKFQINSNWLKNQNDIQQTSNRIKNALLKRQKQLTSVFELIKSNYQRISFLIKSRYLIVNINVQEMIDIKINSSLNKSIFAQDLTLKAGPQNEKNQDILSNIEYLIGCQFKFLLPDLEQLQRQLSHVNMAIKQIKESYRDYRKHMQSLHVSTRKNTFVSQLRLFLREQMAKQYLFAMRYILTQYQQLSYSNQSQYGYLKKEWMKLQEQVKEVTSFDQCEQKIQTFCKVNGKNLEDQTFPNPFNQKQIQSSSINIKPSQKKVIIKVTQSKTYEIQPDNNRKYIKLYKTDTKPTNLTVKYTKCLTYYHIQSQPQQKRYLALALLQENQMNIIRYLSQQRLKYIAKPSITSDKNPQQQEMFKERMPETIKQCFEFTCQKGDKDYSMLYKGFEENQILCMNLWSYNKKTIYSFMYHVIRCIQELQQHFLHQTDLQNPNFIKFGNTFRAIDYQTIFFVKDQQKIQDYFSNNRKIFSCYLNATEISKLSCLTATYSKYNTIKQAFTKQRVNEAVEECINEMEHHMKVNHYDQLVIIFDQLFSKDTMEQQKLYFSQKQIRAIISQFPLKSGFLEFSYQTFLQFNQDIFHIEDKEFNIDQSTHIICRQFCLISSFLRGISKKEKVLISHVKHIKSIIMNISKNPLQSTCQFYTQTWDSKDNVLVSVLDNNSSLNNEIFGNSRYVINFLKSFIMLIIQIKARGYLLLYTTIDDFVRNGEKFILKNIAFLLKIQKEKISQMDELQEQNQEQQSIRLSSLIFLKLYHYNNEDLRKQIFSQQLLTFMQDQLFNYQENSQILNFHNIGPKISLVPQFLRNYRDFIHFRLFKSIAKSVLSQHSRLLGLSRQVKQISETRLLIEGASQQNYLYLKFPEVAMNQSY